MIFSFVNQNLSCIDRNSIFIRDSMCKKLNIGLKQSI